VERLSDLMEEAHIQPGAWVIQRQPIHAGRNQTSATIVAIVVMAQTLALRIQEHHTRV
jgi:hypothetical protein